PLAVKLPEEIDYSRRGFAGLFQGQEVCRPGDIDERRPLAELFLKLLAVFRRRDLRRDPSTASGHHWTNSISLGRHSLVKNGSSGL
ncbi:hypothetical protein ACCS96_40260, partial [Rhizobium ruizarguesonis]